MTGIALVLSEVPEVLAERCRDRVFVREGQRELQFHWSAKSPALPVQWNGGLQLLRWGSKDRRSPLPAGGWLSREQMTSDILANTRQEEVVIPANIGFHKGTWFLIEEGVVGVVLPSTAGGPVVYMLTVPSTNYYRNMTGQSPTMPVFVNQTI